MAIHPNIGPTPNPPLTEFEAWWRTATPTWIQWIIALPCAFVAAAVVMLLLRLALVVSDWMCGAIAIAIVTPPAGFALFLFMLWSMVP